MCPSLFFHTAGEPLFCNLFTLALHSDFRRIDDSPLIKRPEDRKNFTNVRIYESSVKINCKKQLTSRMVCVIIYISIYSRTLFARNFAGSGMIAREALCGY